jgi:hypothetical protein
MRLQLLRPSGSFGNSLITIYVIFTDDRPLALITPVAAPLNAIDVLRSPQILEMRPFLIALTTNSP